jgi:hypothetical protein
MKSFLIPLTVATTGATIFVNPDQIIFVREVNNGTQLVTSVINDGAVMPLVREKMEQINELCQKARTVALA